MKLVSVDKENGLVAFVFEKEYETEILTIKMNIPVPFEDMRVKQIDNFLFKNDALFDEFPYDIKKELACYRIYMPNPEGRLIFKTCMDYIIKDTLLPINVGLVDHPGSPVFIVSFNKNILDYQIVEDMMNAIRTGYENAEFDSYEREEPEEEKPEEDPLDNIDDANIVEFDLDDDVKNMMNPVQKDEYIEMEDDND